MSVEELDSHAGPAERLRREEPDHVLALDDPAWSPDADEARDEPSLSEWVTTLWRRIPDRRIVVPAVAGALVLGLLVGVSATHGWRDRGERIAAEREVFVVATPNTAPTGESRLEDARAETLTYLDLTNRGRLPVTMVGIRVDAAGVTTRPLRNPLVLATGRPRTLPVAVRIDCPVFARGSDGRVRLLGTVRTADGSEREVPLDLPRPRSGGNLFEQGLCTLPQSRAISAEFVDLAPPTDEGIVTLTFRVSGPGRGREPYLIDDVEMPWALRAWVQTADDGPQIVRGDGTLVVVGARLDRCASFQWEPLDSHIQLKTSSLRGRGDADSPVSLGGRFQLDLLAAVTAACGVPDGDVPRAQVPADPDEESDRTSGTGSPVPLPAA